MPVSSASEAPVLGFVVSAGSDGLRIGCERDDCASLVEECPHSRFGCCFFVLGPAARAHHVVD